MRLQTKKDLWIVNAAVTGWGLYSPAQVLSNQDLEKLVDTNDAWIQSRTGIRERRIAGPGETTSSMATIAARQALEEAELVAARSRSDHLRDHHPRSSLARDRLPHPAQSRRRQRRRLRSQHRLHRFSLRAGDRQPVHPGRRGEARPRRRRRNLEPIHQLGRPHHLHPLRRRRRRGRP